jgi:hypothetical protein
LSLHLDDLERLRGSAQDEDEQCIGEYKIEYTLGCGIVQHYRTTLALCPAPHPDKADAIHAGIELVQLSERMFFASADEYLELFRYFRAVAFLVRVQVTVEDTSGLEIMSVGHQPDAGYIRVPFASEQNESVCVELEAVVYLDGGSAGDTLPRHEHTQLSKVWPICYITSVSYSVTVRGSGMRTVL